MAFAEGRRAFGYCDVCGTRWPLRRLRYQVIAAKTTRTRACPDCLDEDSPQLTLGRIHPYDPQGLREPRPDSSLAKSRSGYAWNPVGGLGCTMTGYPQVFVATDVAFNFSFVG